MKKIFFLIFPGNALFIFLSGLLYAQVPESTQVKKEELTNIQQKILFSLKSSSPFDGIKYEAALGTAAIAYWGMEHWAWATEKFHFRSEGWFSEKTGPGGSDKTGHLLSTYLLSDFLTWRLQKKGFDKKTSAAWGAGTVLGLMTFLEIGDGTGNYGFSLEDLAMDSIGALISYILTIRPDIDKKIDLRIEYWPSPGFKLDEDVVADYSGMKHLIALKGSGFKELEDTFLKYFELHFGYYTRGLRKYDKGHFDEERNFYVAVGLNMNAFLGNKKPKLITTFFEYFQTPYTYIPYEFDVKPD